MFIMAYDDTQPSQYFYYIWFVISFVDPLDDRHLHLADLLCFPATCNQP